MNRHRYLLIGSLITILAVLAILSNRIVLADSTMPKEVLHVTKHGWNYKLYRTPLGKVEGIIKPNGTDATAIQSYKRESHRLSLAMANRQGKRPFNVVVTFNKPVSFERFEEVVTSSDILVKRYTIRAFGGDGDRWTIFGSPLEGVLIPSEALNFFVDQIQNETGSADVKGIISFEGTITIDSYRYLLTHPDVFLVDGLAVVAKTDASTYLGVLPDDIVISVSSLYWGMEDAGLVSLQ